MRGGVDEGLYAKKQLNKQVSSTRLSLAHDDDNKQHTFVL
jgi:hypothetical protein